jgi:hypothetical protein
LIFMFFTDVSSQGTALLEYLFAEHAIEVLLPHLVLWSNRLLCIQFSVLLGRPWDLIVFNGICPSTPPWLLWRRCVMIFPVLRRIKSCCLWSAFHSHKGLGFFSRLNNPMEWNLFLCNYGVAWF